MTEIIGISGAVLVLGAFVANQLAFWNNDNWRYDMVNAVGGALLVIYAYFTGSYIFLLINLVWTFFSLRDLVRRQH